jgi:hypothetical protein
MSKRLLTLKMRIPPYRSPRNEWRRVIHAELLKVAESQCIDYTKSDKLELSIVLYLHEKAVQNET